jgi:hypothetical protein
MPPEMLREERHQSPGRPWLPMRRSMRTMSPSAPERKSSLARKIQPSQWRLW